MKNNLEKLFTFDFEQTSFLEVLPNKFGDSALAINLNKNKWKSPDEAECYTHGNSYVLEQLQEYVLDYNNNMKNNVEQFDFDFEIFENSTWVGDLIDEILEVNLNTNFKRKETTIRIVKKAESIVAYQNKTYSTNDMGVIRNDKLLININESIEILGNFFIKEKLFTFDFEQSSFLEVLPNKFGDSVLGINLNRNKWMILGEEECYNNEFTDFLEELQDYVLVYNNNIKNNVEQFNFDIKIFEEFAWVSDLAEVILEVKLNTNFERNETSIRIVKKRESIVPYQNYTYSTKDMGVIRNDKLLLNINESIEILGNFFIKEKLFTFDFEQISFLEVLPNKFGDSVLGINLNKNNWKLPDEAEFYTHVNTYVLEQLQEYVLVYNNNMKNNVDEFNFDIEIFEKSHGEGDLMDEILEVKLITDIETKETFFRIVKKVKNIVADRFLTYSSNDIGVIRNDKLLININESIEVLGNFFIK